MIMLLQLVILFPCACLVTGIFSPTHILPSRDATKTKNALVTTARYNDSVPVKPTSTIVSSSVGRSVQSSTSTPSLSRVKAIANISLKTTFLETASTRTSFPQKSSILDPFQFSLDNIVRKSDLQIASSRVNNSGLNIVCPKGCLCKQCEEGETAGEAMVELKCKTKNLRKLLRKNLSISRNKICSLNLAQNNILSLWKNAFRGFDKLRSLNLDDNKLRDLRKQIFLGLPSLQYLSIRHNNLRTWKGMLHLDLPRIKVLNLEGNNKFSLSPSLLKNTTLSSILGLSYSNSCKNCNFSRENASWDLILPNNKCSYIPQQYYPIAEELLSRFIVFKGRCEMKKECKISLLTGPNTLRYVYKSKCWEVVKMLRPLCIILGILAIVFNTIVVTVIVATKPLRSSTTLLLISHMSFCDFLIGFYAVAIGDGHRVIDDGSYGFRQWRRNFCPYFRSIFVFGQIMEVATSLLVTTERYFAIVFCMNPSIRVNKKYSAIFLFLFWIVASIFSYLLQVYDGSSITDNFMCIIVRNLSNHENTKMFYSQGMMLMLVVIYVVTMLQYLHIYVYVRRSTMNTGARRETKLASRICIMVFSSFIFFAFPNILMMIMTVASVKFPLTSVQNTLLRSWLPPMFLVFNACLNPILFAYRNDKFVSSFKNRIKNLKGVRLASFHVGSRAALSRSQVLVDENSGVRSNAVSLSVLASPQATPCNPQNKIKGADNYDVKQGSHNLAFMTTNM